MRRDPNRVYSIGPEPVIDYHLLHQCKTCRSMLVLGVSKRRWGFHVATRCRCGVYSVESAAFDTRRQAEGKMRRMYAALPDERVAA